jgi:hypothetical protein
MATYLVTWDLNREKQNYAAARARFVGRLDEFENIKDPGLDSVRFVSTTWTADQLSSDLRGYMDDNDKIIVTKLVSGNHQGWLAKSVWDWINARP